MAISQRLDMRQGQSLVMTPQLQQAIKLLQLSNIELAEFVEAEIERNPLLERGEAGDREDYSAEEIQPTSKREELTLDDSSALNEAREAMDASKDDLYESGTNSDSGQTANEMSGPSAKTDWSQAGSGGSFSSDDFDFEGSLSSEKSLHEHLHDQLKMSGLSQADQLIGSRLVDETDDAGYCKVDIDEVATALGADPANVEAVLEVCQGFEPTGVMARTIEECLALQLKERDRFDPAMQALLENLDLVAKVDIKALCDVCGVDKEDVTDMMSELRTLTPRPGAAFSSGPSIAVALLCRSLDASDAREGKGIHHRVRPERLLADQVSRPAGPHHPESRERDCAPAGRLLRAWRGASSPAQSQTGRRRHRDARIDRQPRDVQ